MLALRNVAVAGRLASATLEIAAGVVAGVIGPNGSGKSTLLEAAAGVLDATGEIRWNGRDIARIPALERGRLAAWTPQRADFEFGFTVRSVVAQGRFASGDDDTGVAGALDAFDLAGLARRPVTRLSGGERQRVLLARALATGAPLQLWDEPLAPLDPRHALETLALARRLAAAGGTVIISLHDLALAGELDVVVVLDKGRVTAAGAPATALTPALIREVFRVNSALRPRLVLEMPEQSPRSSRPAPPPTPPAPPTCRAP